MTIFSRKFAQIAFSGILVWFVGTCLVAMDQNGDAIMSAVAAGSEAEVISLFRHTDWLELRRNEAFITKVLSCLAQNPSSISPVDKVISVRCRTWLTYVLGKLNAASPLQPLHVADWAKNLESDSNYLNKIGIEDNHVNVTIYQLGDYQNLDSAGSNEEFGLAYCVSEQGKASFPVFSHTAIDEFFEFLGGRGYTALFAGDSFNSVRVVSVAQCNALTAAGPLKEGILYLVGVHPTDKLFLPAKTNIQFCSFNDEPLRFLIYSNPPFSYIEQGKTKSVIAEKPEGFWHPGAAVHTNQNPLFRVLALLQNNECMAADELFDDVSFADLSNCVTLMSDDYKTILELFTFFAEVIPTVESLHFSSKHSRYNVRSQWWDFIAAFFGIEESYEIARNEKARNAFMQFLALDDMALQRKIVDSFIKSLPFHTFHSSAALRVAPLALAVINQISGKKNLYDTSVLTEFPQSELAQNLNNHLYFTIPALWHNQFTTKDLAGLHTPCLEPLTKLKKRNYRWLDVATAPKGNGSTAINFLRRVFKEFLPEITFSFCGTDILFPTYAYDELSKKFFKPFQTIESTGRDVVNDISFYDGRKPTLNFAEAAFDGDEFGTYDFITMIKAFHHFHGHDSVKRLMPLAQNIRNENITDTIRWCDHLGKSIDAPLYRLDDAQQRTMENLLGRLNHEGILFIELCFLHLPDFKFMQSNNEDVFVIIKRLSDNKFMIHSQVIPFNPQPFESFPYVEFLLHGDERGNASRYYYRIGNGFAGFIKAYGLANFDESAMNKLQQLLKEAHLLVYRYQQRDKSPWCQLRDAAQAVREHKSLREAMQTYMDYVPENSDKQRVLQNLEELCCHQP